MKIKSRNNRRGAIAVLTAVMLVALLGMVSFAVDYGYLVKIRTDMQRAADAAALAAVRDLAPNATGAQNPTAAKSTAVAYVRENLDDPTFQVPDGDIEIGRYDPTSIYSNVTILNGGMLDTVRITIRRDGTTNPSVPLYFARLLGIDNSTVIARATAVLRAADALVPGNGVLPIAVDITEWNAANTGDEFVMYADGRFEDGNGNTRSGNWGTVDIGDAGNSTSDLRDQMVDGIRQSDLDTMANQLDPWGDPRIPDNTELRAPVWTGGDTGLSSGMRHGLSEIMGEPKIIPLVDQIVGGSGNNSEFHIVGWGIIKVNSYSFQGSNKHVTVEKIYAYDGTLKPTYDLSDPSDDIEGAYGPAGLVE